MTELTDASILDLKMAIKGLAEKEEQYSLAIRNMKNSEDKVLESHKVYWSALADQAEAKSAFLTDIWRAIPDWRRALAPLTKAAAP